MKRLKNELALTVSAQSKQSMAAMSMMVSPADTCGDSMMTASSVNVHAHGTNLPPVCHQDEVIKTMVNPSQTFEYD